MKLKTKYSADKNTAKVSLWNPIVLAVMILFLQRLQILNNVRGDLRADELRNMATFEELQTENGVGYVARYLNISKQIEKQVCTLHIQ